MTASDVLLMIIIFSGILLCICVVKFIRCAEEYFSSEAREPLQNKETYGADTMHKK